jgi:hypothetical protein
VCRVDFNITPATSEVFKYSELELQSEKSILLFRSFQEVLGITGEEARKKAKLMIWLRSWKEEKLLQKMPSKNLGKGGFWNLKRGKLFLGRLILCFGCFQWCQVN